MWCLVEEKSNQDSCELNYDIGLEIWYTPEVEEWRYIASLDSWKQTVSGRLTNRDGEHGNCHINGYIPDTRECAYLLKQWIHIWYSGCSWSQRVVKFTIIQCPSLKCGCLLHRPSKCTEWENGSNQNPASFKSLMVALISVISPGMWYCSWFTIFLERGGSNGFYLAFYYHESPHSIGQGTNVGNLPVLSMPLPIVHSGIGDMTSG